MGLLLSIPESLRLLASNPHPFDFSSDGPNEYTPYQKITRRTSMPPDLRIEPKTILMARATSGVGLEASRHFMKLKARLIVGVRKVGKGKQVKHALVRVMPGGS